VKLVGDALVYGQGISWLPQIAAVQHKSNDQARCVIAAVADAMRHRFYVAV
jgi:hypothetical protein